MLQIGDKMVEETFHNYVIKNIYENLKMTNECYYIRYETLDYKGFKHRDIIEVASEKLNKSIVIRIIDGNDVKIDVIEKHRGKPDTIDNFIEYEIDEFTLSEPHALYRINKIVEINMAKFRRQALLKKIKSFFIYGVGPYILCCILAYLFELYFSK